MILEYVVTSPSNLTITLPLYGSVNAIVIWGDTQSDEYTTTGNKTHTYTTAGSYTVYIGGLVTQFGNGLSGYPNADRLQSVVDWGIIGLTSLSGAFNSATSLTSVPVSLPTTSIVTDLSYCFKDATSFNDINVVSWFVEDVINMTSMFEGASSFNQPIGNWENHTHHVLYMTSMFKNATLFNQNLGAWDVSSVLLMDSMFEGVTSFDQNIGTWNVSLVTSMINMFLGVTISTINYDALIDGWRGLPSLRSNVNFHGGSSMYSYGTTSDNRLYLKKNYNWTITDGGVVLATLPPPMTLTYTITNPLSRSITLPLYGIVDVIVNWGDSSTTEYDTTGDKTHNYASLGTYEVSINKTLSQFGNGSTSYANVTKLVSIGSFGGIRLTSLSGAFNGASSLSSIPISLPTTSLITDLSYSFKGASSMNDSNISSWDVSSITNMTSMLENATSFNQDVSGWNVSNVETMDDIFKGVTLSLTNYDSLLLTWKLLPTLFNDVNFHGGNSMYSYGLAAQARLYIQSTYGWNFTDGGIEPSTLPPAMELVYEVDGSTSNTITLPLYGMVDVIIEWGDGNSEICTTAGDLNHTYLIDGTYTVLIKNMLTQFGHGSIPYANADRLKQVISFGGLLLTSLSGAFLGAASLISVPLTLPTTSSITELSYCFKGASIFNDVDIIAWDVSTVTDMTSMFEEASSFNQNIHDWDTSNVTSMKAMFKFASSYNNNNSVYPDIINKWNTISVTDMSEMFYYASAFNQPLSLWNTSNVTTMYRMFSNATNFNQPINNWDTALVTDMSYMFRQALHFNQDLNNWDTILVTTMSNMFIYAEAFDGNINSWNTSNVTDMSYMFYNTLVFNQNISNWNTTSVTNMNSMFTASPHFNQDISLWDTSSVTTMSNMFDTAYNFNQNLANLSIINVNTNFNDIFRNSGLSSLNYTRTLIGWANQVTITQSNLVLNTNGKQYYDDATTARNTLTSTPYSWTINDGGSLGSMIPTPSLASFRYYKLIITQTRSMTDYVHASEFVFYDINNEKIDMSTFSIINVNGSNPVGNEVTKLTDNSPFTDWVDLNGPRGGIKLGGEVIIDFGVDFLTKVRPEYYSYYTANDNIERDPKSWILYCSQNMVKYYNVSQIIGYTISTKRNYEVTSSIDGENYFSITYPPDPTINRSIYRVNGGDSVTLPLFGVVNVTIDWGDSTIETVNVAGMKYHTYASAGDYVVKMTGNLEQFGNGIDGYPNADKLISITSFGYLGIISLAGVFKDAINLETCPDFIPETVTNLEYAFYGASKFNDPIILEWDLTNVIDISYMFFYAISFNQNIFVWNTASLVHKRFFLYGASSFSQPITGWLEELQQT
jgi:surface protein